MKAAAIPFIVISLVFVCSCSESKEGNDGHAPPAAASLLSDEALRRLQMAALRGDEAATSAVVEHYYAVDLRETPELEYWLTIASENGHVGKMVDLARLLVRKGDPASCQRAMFWYMKIQSARNQNEKTRVMLERVDGDLKAQIMSCQKQRSE